jgi:cytochrome b6-f complex iron-sulfur subunit
MVFWPISPGSTKIVNDCCRYSVYLGGNCATMERKDFLKNTLALIGCAVVPAALIEACGKDNSTQTNVNFTLDLTQSANAALNTVGNSLIVNNTIIIRSSQSVFNAFSSVCTHAGCQVNYDPATPDLIYCRCHSGTFSSVTGGVESGPPPLPLPRYTATLNGNILTIKS